MFTLSSRDFWNGLVMAIAGPTFVALTAVVGSVIGAPNFDVFTVNWGMLGHNLINIEIVVSYGAFTGYLTKNFFTNSEGAVLGINATK